jgi:hypothetical protein
LTFEPQVSRGLAAGSVTLNEGDLDHLVALYDGEILAVDCR